MAVTAATVSAEEVALQIRGGRVTLKATDATVRQILAEWVRVGNTRIVNLEQVAGPPQSIELRDVPEAEALAVVLRSVAGYVAAPRRAGTPGASAYDRVMILAASRAPAPAARPLAQAPPDVEPAQPEPEPPVMADIEPAVTVAPQAPAARSPFPAAPAIPFARPLNASPVAAAPLGGNAGNGRAAAEVTNDPSSIPAAATQTPGAVVPPARVYPVPRPETVVEPPAPTVN